MKLASLALVLASAASTALAAVAAPAPGPAVALAQAAALAPAIHIRPYKEIKCRTSKPENNVAQELHVTRRWNIPYLDEPDKVCDVRPGPDGCGRISCSWNAGIHICQKNITQPIDFMCYEAAEWARQIVNKCGNSDLVVGAAYDAEKDFSVELFFSPC